MTSSTADTAAASVGAHIRHGDHVDTIESVDLVFRMQRRLSFTYGAIFFIVTLAIPALSAWAPWWYSSDSAIWGGFTLNYLFVSLLYYVFLWVMAWTYSQRADKLDEKLEHMAEKMTADVAAATSEEVG